VLKIDLGVWKCLALRTIQF